MFDRLSTQKRKQLEEERNERRHGESELVCNQRNAPPPTIVFDQLRSRNADEELLHELLRNQLRRALRGNRVKKYVGVLSTGAEHRPQRSRWTAFAHDHQTQEQAKHQQRDAGLLKLQESEEEGEDTSVDYTSDNPYTQTRRRLRNNALRLDLRHQRLLGIGLARSRRFQSGDVEGNVAEARQSVDERDTLVVRR